LSAGKAQQRVLDDASITQLDHTVGPRHALRGMRDDKSRALTEVLIDQGRRSDL
jgi:hypothetical protein